MTADGAYISRTLHHAAAAMTPREVAELRDGFEHYEREMRRSAKGGAVPAALALHQAVDAFVADTLRTTPHKVQCARGCSACCHLAVEVVPEEAALLAQVIRDEGIAIDRARLARQSEALALALVRDDHATVADWKTLAPADRACVLLAEDGSCRAYAHRPSACRKYMVTTDPELCDTFKHDGADVGIVFSLQAELVHSAACTELGVDTLPGALAKALGELESRA